MQNRYYIYEYYRLLLNLSGKVKLKKSDKYVNIKTSYKINKFKISAPSWNEKFELPDGSNSAWDIQD